MAEIIGNSPIKGPSDELDKRFERWWYFLNGLGIFSFLIAVDIHGDEYQQGKAIAALLILTWLFIIGRTVSWPHFVSKVRKEDPELAKKINKDYLSFFKVVVGYFPYVFGSTYLFLLALNQLI